MPIGAVMGGAAVLGAGASIYSGSKASKAQKQAADASVAEQRRQYDTTRADFAPWREAGSGALGLLSRAYGINGGTPDMTAFTTSPGYQFRLNEGLRATERQASSRGLLRSGAAQKALLRYGEGQAAGEFGDWWNRLAGVAGLGQAGVSGTAAAGSNAANNISQALTAGGNARASSYANTGSAINSGINNVLFAYLNQGKG
jgi:hypothetical protein